MSKGNKVLILVLLLFATSSAFAAAQRAGHPQLTAFLAFFMLGLLIAIPAVALSRRGSRRR